MPESPSLHDIIRKAKADYSPGRGRPSKLDRSSAEKITIALEMGATRRAAAAAGGITFKTFYNWIDAGRQAEDQGADNDFLHFLHAVEVAEGMAELRYTKRVHDACEGDWKAALEWLKRRRRLEWGDKIDVGSLTNEQILEALAYAEELEAGSPYRVP